MLLAQATTTIDILDSVQKTSVGGSLPTSTPGMIASMVNAAILVGAILLLVYLIWGAIEWITSGGDKGKVESARNKIIQALIGFFVVVFMYTIYIFVLNLLGLDFGQSGASGGSNNVGGGGGGCNASTVNNRSSDGGAGGYCTNGGAAEVQCFGPGEGVSGFNYYHYEPCGCLSGQEKPNYDFSSC